MTAAARASIGLALATAAAALVACSATNTPTSPTSTVTRTHITRHTVAPPTAALSVGPTRTTRAARCPLLRTTFVANTVGMRLARITVSRSGSTVSGCRYYALQNSPLSVSERLPGPNQPAVELTRTRYPSATAAHNVVATLARGGTNPQQHRFAGGRVGVCFQTDFYPADRGQDWACAVNSGAQAVLVRTVVTSPALDAVWLTQALLRGSG